MIRSTWPASVGWSLTWLGIVIPRALKHQRGPRAFTRDSLITLIILGQLLRLHLIPFRPLEIAVFIRAISQAHLAIAKADAQLLALQRAKDAGR